MARRDATHVRRQQSARVPTVSSEITATTPTPTTQKEEGVGIEIAGTIYTSLEQAITAGVEALYREQANDEQITEEESFEEEEELEPV